MRSINPQTGERHTPAPDMSKLILEFNPDCMKVADVKAATNILRMLMQRREVIASTHDAEKFLQSFDVLTQNVEAT